MKKPLIFLPIAERNFYDEFSISFADEMQKLQKEYGILIVPDLDYNEGTKTAILYPFKNEMDKEILEKAIDAFRNCFS